MCGRDETYDHHSDMDPLMGTIRSRVRGERTLDPWEAFDAMKARLKVRQTGEVARSRQAVPLDGSEPVDLDPYPRDRDGLPGEVRLSDEARQNIERAPEGTRFFCMLDDQGRAHCAAGSGVELGDHQMSRVKGQAIAPIAPTWEEGTGHQQLARKIGLGFNEETAYQGYVEDDEGYGISIEKIGEDERAYKYNSAFNLKTNDDYSRTLPESFQERIHTGIEAALSVCDKLLG